MCAQVTGSRDRHNRLTPLLAAVICATACLIVGAMAVHAEGISIETAEKAAIAFMGDRAPVYGLKSIERGPAIQAEPEPPIPPIVTVSKDGVPVYYVVNFEPEGWLILAANDVSRPVIAYSTEGANIPDGDAPAYTEWMGLVADDIHNAIASGMDPLPVATSEWLALLASASAGPSALRGGPQAALGAPSSGAGGPTLKAAVYGPLLSTKWGQGGQNQLGVGSCSWPSVWAIPWLVSEDRYCPWEKSKLKYVLGVLVPPYFSYYRVAPTGCVATATGQVMKYHSWPPKGKGSHTSDPPFAAGCENTYGPKTVNFAAETYNWSAMTNNPGKHAADLQPSGDKEVAKLLRHLGVALDMDYEPGGSSASTSSVDTILETYFFYDAEDTYRSSKTDTEWKNLLNSELAAGRPMVYRGADVNGDGGHAFVCDGLDDTGKYHFNWGWDGSKNGWFAIDDLTPGDDYRYGQLVVHGIEPDKDPEAKCKDATAYLDVNGLATVSSAQINNGSVDPAGGTLNFSLTPWSFSCADVGDSEVSLTVFNNWGGQDFCKATVTVKDTRPPDIVFPNPDIECGQPTDVDSVGWAVVTDNCDRNPTLTHDGDEISHPGLSDCGDHYAIYRHWLATDLYGNWNTEQQHISVVDTTPPTLTLPVDITVECDTSTDPDATGWATAEDGCASEVSVTYTDTVTAGDCIGSWTITRHWTATDNCRNSSTGDQIITVVDSTGPEITPPPDVTVECDAPTDPSATGWATATDNCSPDPIPSYSDEIIAGGCANEWTILRTWTAEDDCENVGSEVQTITVVDTTPPELAMPADLILECDQPTDPGATGEATATDNCDPGPAITYVDVEIPGGCPQEKTIERTWTATDDCENASSLLQTIVVVDTKAPVISCNAPETITPLDSPVSLAATAVDNCDGEPLVIVTAYDCFRLTKKGKHIDMTMACDVVLDGPGIDIAVPTGVGMHITWVVYAVDACGNESTADCGVLVINPGHKSRK